MLTLKNALIYSVDGSFKRGSLVTDGGKISAASTPAGGDIFDVKGCRVIPGLIDIHTHGAIGIDSMSADLNDFIKLSRFYAKNGVTSFMPTTITASIGQICSALENIRDASAQNSIGAAIAGVHIEGPYISPKHKGCHDERYIRSPDNEDYLKFKKIMGNRLKLRFTVAPEIEGAREFIELVCKAGDEVTLGHCDAGYEQCMAALSLGANCFTHLFNAMRGLHHREPGAVGAALISGAYTELICDGVHLHPDIVKLVLCIKGIDKIVLVTDSMSATGMEDGSCVFGGMDISVKSGIARTADGTLAGSTLLLIDGLRNFIKFTGMPLERALPAVTINPARVIGIDGITGSIEAGKRADLVVLDSNLNVAATICAGQIAYNTFC